MVEVAVVETLAGLCRPSCHALGCLGRHLSWRRLWPRDLGHDHGQLRLEPLQPPRGVLPQRRELLQPPPGVLLQRRELLQPPPLIATHDAFASLHL